MRRRKEACETDREDFRKQLKWEETVRGDGLLVETVRSGRIGLAESRDDGGDGKK